MLIEDVWGALMFTLAIIGALRVVTYLVTTK